MNDSKKDLIGKRISSLIDMSTVINYCLGSSLKLPYPPFLNPIILIGLSLLTLLVNSIFWIFLIISLLIIIVLGITSYKKYIIVFLNDNLLIINIKGNDFNIINSHTYKYHDITNTTNVKGKTGVIELDYKLGIRFTPNPDNSSFSLENFDFEKFVYDQQHKKKSDQNVQ